jgi:hypothetical protein
MNARDSNMSDDIIEELRRIAAAMEKSANAIKVSKQPELWNIQEIATWMDKSYEHVRDRVVKIPGFPLPTEGKRYFADEVVEWFRLNRGKLGSTSYSRSEVCN